MARWARPDWLGASGRLLAALAVLAVSCGGSAPASSQKPASPSPRAACRPLSIPAPSTHLATAAVAPEPGYALTRGSGPVGISVARDGVVWTLGVGANRIARLQGGQLTEFQLPASGLGWEGAVGQDGSFWFPERSRDAVAAIDAQGHVVECNLPGQFSNRQPAGMAFDPAGNLWLTEYAGNQIDVMRPGGHFQGFSLPGSGKAPTEMVAGPDGAMWFRMAATQWAASRLKVRSPRSPWAVPTWTRSG